MDTSRLKILISAAVLFILSSTSHWWRDVEPAEWHHILMLWVFWPGWGLWNIFRFYKHKEMGVGLWSAGPEKVMSQKLLAVLCFFMIITPLFAPAKAAL